MNIILFSNFKMESKNFECLSCGKDKKQRKELEMHINGKHVPIKIILNGHNIIAKNALLY